MKKYQKGGEADPNVRANEIMKRFNDNALKSKVDPFDTSNRKTPSDTTGNATQRKAYDDMVKGIKKAQSPKPKVDPYVKGPWMYNE